MWRKARMPVRQAVFWLLAADFPLLFYAGTGSGEGMLAAVALGLLAGAGALAALVY
jgi:hypothetical protein